MGMGIFLGGIALFFGAHLFSAVRSREAGRDIKDRMGAGAYMGLYSLVSLAGFAALVWGFSQAPRDAILYTPPAWGRHVALGLMLPALILLVSAYLPAGRIKKMARHPMLAAVKLWALGHLFANGELRSLILFGAFLAYGVIDRIALKRRGDHGPSALATNAALWDFVAVAGGAGLYVLVGYVLHPVLFGAVAIG
jgi:uncharacterized membrane protein